MVGYNILNYYITEGSIRESTHGLETTLRTILSALEQDGTANKRANARHRQRYGKRGTRKGSRATTPVPDGVRFSF